MTAKAIHPMSTTIIKRANTEDLAALQNIGRQTFFETFAAENTEENMRKYLEEGFSTEKLGAELNDPNAEFYLALEGNSVLGYLKVNVGASQTELQDEQALEIERIYVAKACHGKGLGQLLYEKAIQIALQKKVAYVWLGVWENNLKAINFYKKNGFVEFDKHLFTLGDEVQTDLMMKRSI